MGLTSQIKKMFLRKIPQTAGYHSAQPMYGYGLFEDRPVWSIWQADLMLLDHQVWFGLQLGNAPLLSAEVIVECRNPEVKAFVEETWEAIWRTSATKIFRSKYFGYGGYEVVYKYEKGQIKYDFLIDFHVRDVAPLKDPKDGRIVGVAAYNSNSTIRDRRWTKDRIFWPRALWLTYNSECGRLFGRSILERAFAPWYEKTMTSGGAIQTRRLRMLKDAWIGDRITYPIGREVLTPDGKAVSWRDLVREIGENRATGGMLALPSDRDELGNLLVEYTPPTGIQGQTEVAEWIKDLDFDIFDGVLVPKEVVEAATSGSGFSGRSIPFVAFLAVRDDEFAHDIRQLDGQVIRSLVAANFGKQEYTITGKPLLETVGAQMGDMGKPNTSSGDPADKAAAQPPPQNQPPAQSHGRPGGLQPKQPNTAQQFSAGADVVTPGVVINGRFFRDSGLDIITNENGEQWSVAHAPTGGITTDHPYKGGQFYKQGNETAVVETPESIANADKRMGLVLHNYKLAMDATLETAIYKDQLRKAMENYQGGYALDPWQRGAIDTLAGENHIAGLSVPDAEGYQHGQVFVGDALKDAAASTPEAKAKAAIDFATVKKNWAAYQGPLARMNNPKYAERATTAVEMWIAGTPNKDSASAIKGLLEATASDHAQYIEDTFYDEGDLVLRDTVESVASGSFKSRTPEEYEAFNKEKIDALKNDKAINSPPYKPDTDGTQELLNNLDYALGENGDSEITKDFKGEIKQAIADWKDGKELEPNQDGIIDALHGADDFSKLWETSPTETNMSEDEYTEAYDKCKTAIETGKSSEEIAQQEEQDAIDAENESDDEENGDDEDKAEWEDSKDADTERAQNVSDEIWAKASYEEWSKSLTTEEHQAISQYTTSEYRHFNRNVRKCPETLDCLSEKDAKQLAALQAIIEKYPKDAVPEDEVFYRGFNGWDDDAKELIDAARSAAAISGTIVFNGVSSCSLDHSISAHFARDNGPMFRIKAKSGAYIAKESSTSSTEYELIQPHGTVYHVTGISKEEDFNDDGEKIEREYIDMEEVREGTKAKGLAEKRQGAAIRARAEHNFTFANDFDTWHQNLDYAKATPGADLKLIKQAEDALIDIYNSTKPAKMKETLDAISDDMVKNMVEVALWGRVDDPDEKAAFDEGFANYVSKQPMAEGSGDFEKQKATYKENFAAQDLAKYKAEKKKAADELVAVEGMGVPLKAYQNFKQLYADLPAIKLIKSSQEQAEEDLSQAWMYYKKGKDPATDNQKAYYEMIVKGVTEPTSMKIHEGSYHAAAHQWENLPTDTKNADMKKAATKDQNSETPASPEMQLMNYHAVMSSDTPEFVKKSAKSDWEYYQSGKWDEYKTKKLSEWPDSIGPHIAAIIFNQPGLFNYADSEKLKQ